jgi:hypothetical protein
LPNAELGRKPQNLSVQMFYFRVEKLRPIQRSLSYPRLQNISDGFLGMFFNLVVD